MAVTTPAAAAVPARSPDETTVLAVLFAISFSHLLNDLMQSLLPAIYPMLKESHGLSFAQIGLITLAFQLTASLLQPLIGLYTDRRPQPYSLALGMGLTLCGLLLLSRAGSYPLLLLAAALVGTGSAVFHPESSRVARVASGGRLGFAQSLFQVGGNAGSAAGPLLAAFVVIPGGQPSVAWFSLAALLAMVVLWNVGSWYKRRRAAAGPRPAGRAGEGRPALPPRRVAASLAILVALMFSKFFYTASMGNYFTFYLIAKFGLSVQAAQLHLFVFLLAMAAGTFVGGPVGDRFGRKRVIWGSILGALPFTLLLPHANLFWTGVLSAAAGLVIASAFSAILVYAQELLPGRVGLVSGLFFGLAFGMGGLGAASLGRLADLTSIETVFALCAFLPALGLLTAFLPDLDRGVPRPTSRETPQSSGARA